MFQVGLVSVGRDGQKAPGAPGRFGVRAVEWGPVG